MMKNLVKRGVCALAFGAAALVLSAGQAFALPTEMVMDTVTDQDGGVYLYAGGGGANSDRALRFDLKGDGNWGTFQGALSSVSPSYEVTSAIFHIWVTPLDPGFSSDRHRLFTSDGMVGDNSDPKLMALHGMEIVRLKEDLGIIGMPWAVDELLDYEFDLVDWYSANDLKDLILNNDGILNIGSADDAYVHMGKLTVTVSPVPEPATLFLFGSGLVGLAAWRLRKNQPRV